MLAESFQKSIWSVEWTSKKLKTEFLCILHCIYSGLMVEDDFINLGFEKEDVIKSKLTPEPSTNKEKEMR